MGGTVLARTPDHPVLAVVGAAMAALGLVAFLATRRGVRAGSPESPVAQPV